MKTKLTLIALLLSISGYAVSSEQAAPAELISETLETCKQYAIEDGVPQDDLNNYLLDCVNEELEANGYLRIESIDD